MVPYNNNILLLLPDLYSLVGFQHILRTHFAGLPVAADPRLLNTCESMEIYSNLVLATTTAERAPKSNIRIHFNVIICTRCDDVGGGGGGD